MTCRHCHHPIIHTRYGWVIPRSGTAGIDIGPFLRSAKARAAVLIPPPPVLAPSPTAGPSPRSADGALRPTGDWYRGRR